MYNGYFNDKYLIFLLFIYLILSTFSLKRVARRYETKSEKDDTPSFFPFFRIIDFSYCNIYLKLYHKK